MGMDVFGNNPTSKVGSHFRNTDWAWPPLAEYVRRSRLESPADAPTGNRTMATA